MEEPFRQSAALKRSRSKSASASASTQPSNPSLFHCFLLGEEEEMDEPRSLMKRTKSLVSKSTDEIPVGTTCSARNSSSSRSGVSGDSRNKLLKLVSLAQEETNWISSPRNEPRLKRRVFDESSSTSATTCAFPDLHTKVPDLKANNTSDDDDDDSEGNATSTVTAEGDLPDPSTETSPDEYLLALVKAMLGAEFEVKPALSLKSFFAEVTEEQMAAYTMEVVGSVRNNDLELLKKLHGKGQPLDCFNRFGESLLNMACRRGFESIAYYLMESGTVDVRICDDSGRTPLHDACWNPSPQLAICQSLIEREPALLLVADRRGCTAFQYARKEHWDEWRTFLFQNRKFLLKLKEPDTVSKFAKS